jgi:hypothetical protein
MEDEWIDGNLVKKYAYDNKRQFLWFEMVPSTKILECIANGARVHNFIIKPPEGPSQKITVNITLSASDSTPFIHASKFIKKWDTQFKDFKNHLDEIEKSDTLGTDLNKLGKHIVALSTPKQQLDLTQRLQYWENVFQRLEKMRKYHLPNIMKNIAELEKKNNNLQPDEIKRLGRLKAQEFLYFRRRKNLLRHFKREAMMVILYVTSRLKIKKLGLDGIKNITTKGKTSRLAIAINTLPQSEDLINQFLKWANYLKDLGYIDDNLEIQSINPHTGQFCPKYLTKILEDDKKGIEFIELAKNKDRKTLYREFVCKECDYGHPNPMPRDSTAAQITAIFMQKQIKIKN